MRYFQAAPDTRFYAGVAFHARSLFLVVLILKDGEALRNWWAENR